jgi:hypothetical protein
MSKHTYWIYRQPLGIAYQQLIDFCVKRCPWCTFALQNPQQFEKSCYQYLDSLKENLIEVVDQMEWPGTRLTRSAARVHWYRVTPELAVELKARVSGIYAWELPNLPEDLAFYWPDGGALLGTSSHERFAFTNLSNAEAGDFAREVPALRLNKFPPLESL